MSQPVLSVRNLNIDYVGAEGDFHAVKNVSFDIAPGEFFGLAGESGCGKSTIAFAISRLHRPPALIRTGSVIEVNGRNVLELDDADLRRFRWREVAMVFQSAMNSLNPVLTIERQFYDVLKAHGPISRAAARERAAELLKLVDIAPDGRWFTGEPLAQRKNYLFDVESIKTLTQVTLDTNRSDGMQRPGRLRALKPGFFGKAQSFEFDIALPAFDGDPADGTCIFTGEPAVERVLVARAY